MELAAALGKPGLVIAGRTVFRREGELRRRAGGRASRVEQKGE